MMYPIKIFCDFISFDLVYPQQVELYVNCIPDTIKTENSIRFVYLIEPVDIQNERNKALFCYKKTYDFLLTHDNFLLERIQDSSLLEFGSCWVKDYEHGDKDFSISFVCGGKSITKGHSLRREIWENESQISNIRKRFYLSGHFAGNLKNPKEYPVLGNKKSDLFVSQFHLCIENSRQSNFFTEKLIDALYTKTVPVYYGCDNISNWFDTRGMILVNSLEETLLAVKQIREDTYEKMLPFVEENHKRSVRFVDFNAHVKRKVCEILGV